MTSKSISYLSIPVIFLVILFNGCTSSDAAHILDHDAASDKVIDVLTHTENAIAGLRIDTTLSLDNVTKALALIDEIDKIYDVNTSNKLKEQDSTIVANSYTHYYPQVDLHTIEKTQGLETLKHKLDNAVIYNSETFKASRNHQDLFFDYEFAKASLKTAKLALHADHDLEAMANLRRVFEAFYASPEFNVSNIPNRNKLHQNM